MFSNIPKQKHVNQEIGGIGFDQHYTDSALKLLAPKSYGRHKKWVKTKRSIPKQELLVSLLLFGKAYLTWPSWLTATEFPELERFEKEELIEWVPETIYEASFRHLGVLVDKLFQRAYSESTIGIVPLTLSGKLRMRDFNKEQLEKEIVESELEHDIAFMIEKLFYVSPLVKGNLEHLGFKSPDPASPLLFPVKYGAPSWIPTELFALSDPWYTFRDFRQDYNGSCLGWMNNYYDAEGASIKYQNDLGIVLDVAISTLAAERFATETLLPMKTAGGKGLLPIKNNIYGSDAYQLVKFQFQDIRYPVIQSIEDVLRLRDDPHLKSYRTVIAEYSERLRQKLEGERPQVIEDFRKDIQLALKSLTVVRRWSKIVDLSFYISIPLVIIGALSGLPLSDILAIPLTSYAKIVSHQKRKELDWILFGRPGGA